MEMKIVLNLIKLRWEAYKKSPSERALQNRWALVVIVTSLLGLQLIQLVTSRWTGLRAPVGVQPQGREPPPPSLEPKRMELDGALLSAQSTYSCTKQINCRGPTQCRAQPQSAQPAWGSLGDAPACSKLTSTLRERKSKTKPNRWAQQEPQFSLFSLFLSLTHTYTHTYMCPCITGAHMRLNTFILIRKLCNSLFENNFKHWWLNIVTSEQKGFIWV